MNDQTATTPPGSAPPGGSAQCPKCNGPMIMMEQCITGYPDHHIKGTRKHHCFACDGPATATLTVGLGSHILVPNDPSSATAATGDVERKERRQITMSLKRKAGRRFAAAPWLGHVKVKDIHPLLRPYAVTVQKAAIVAELSASGKDLPKNK
jgi:hypothetical protein